MLKIILINIFAFTVKAEVFDELLKCAPEKLDAIKEVNKRSTVFLQALYSLVGLQSTLMLFSIPPGIVEVCQPTCWKIRTKCERCGFSGKKSDCWEFNSREVLYGV